MTVVDADMTVERIISGGQTGADSAALDFAVARGIPHGGWGPKRRRTEDGVIPDRYLLREKPGREYRQRTERNVRDSDATVIFTVSQEVTGGSELTAELAAKHGKPWLHLAREVPGDPVARLREFLAAHSVKVLNVARSRASKEPEVGKFVEGVLNRAFEALRDAALRFPDHEPVRYDLVCLGYALGRWFEAEWWLADALEIGGERLRQKALEDAQLEPRRPCLVER